MALLDQRTSQGSKAGPVTTALVTPDFIAGIGLLVGSAADIRVGLEASVGVSTTVDNNLIIWVVRHLDPADFGNFASGTVVYVQTFGIPELIDTTTFSLSAADLPPTPVSGQLNYALYAAANLAGTSYQGLQNLIGLAAN